MLKLSSSRTWKCSFHSFNMCFNVQRTSSWLHTETCPQVLGLPPMLTAADGSSPIRAPSNGCQPKERNVLTFTLEVYCSCSKEERKTETEWWIELPAVGCHLPPYVVHRWCSVLLHVGAAPAILTGHLGFRSADFGYPGNTVSQEERKGA